MLFADAELVRRIESAECRLTTELAETVRARGLARPVFVAELAGGVAVHAGAEAPFNKLIGLGLHGPLDAAAEGALTAIEQEFNARGAAVQAEIATLADSSVVRLLSERGYHLVGFENVLGLQLADLTAERLRAAPPAGLLISRLDAAPVQEWLDTVLTGFLHADAVPGGESHESFQREALEQALRDMAQVPGLTRYLARFAGAAAGAASLRCCERIAQLCGSATLPGYRRRGVQTALLAARLLDARDGGCDVAVITTQPGSKSQQNAQRYGFALLYSRAVLVRAPR